MNTEGRQSNVTNLGHGSQVSNQHNVHKKGKAQLGIQYSKHSDQQAYSNLSSISQCSSKTSIRIPHAILYKNNQPKTSAGADKET